MSDQYKAECNRCNNEWELPCPDQCRTMLAQGYLPQCPRCGSVDVAVFRRVSDLVWEDVTP